MNPDPKPITKIVRNETVELDGLSDASRADCEALIGKTITRVIGREFDFTIFLSDGTRMTCSGHRWDGCSLGVDFGSLEEEPWRKGQ